MQFGHLKYSRISGMNSNLYDWCQCHRLCHITQFVCYSTCNRSVKKKKREIVIK